MPAKQGFSERAWEEIINEDMAGAWIDAVIESARRRPGEPFADAGPLLAAMLQKGVTKEQLCRLARMIRYEAVFATVTLAAEEGLDAEQLDGVHEELLSADPSGLEGRPGSWPVEPEPAPVLPAARRAKIKTKLPKKRADAPAKAATTRRRDFRDAPLLTLPQGDAFAFTPDGSRLWLARTSVTATMVRGFAVPGGEAFAEFNTLPNLRSLACAPDAGRLAATNHDGVVAILDVRGKELWKSAKTNEESRQVAFTPDGSVVLSSGSETCVRRRDAKTGKELPPLDLGKGWLAGNFAFSPDGDTLALVGVEIPGAAFVSYWDWRVGEERSRHREPALISDVAFQPDGRHLVVAGSREVSLRDVTSHDRSPPFKLTQPLWGASLHPAGHLLACDTTNGSEIRAMPSGKLLMRLDTKKMFPRKFAFSPDGRHVLLATRPKSFLWNVSALLGEAANET